MKYIDDVTLTNKRILVRVDFNVSLDPRHHIGNDERIRQSLPTLKHLLQKNNTLILLSHLGRPKGYEKNLSLAPIAKRLQEYLPEENIELLADLDLAQEKILRNSKGRTIFLLENIRFYEGEENNDPSFVKQLAALGDIYVNDAFSVSHRESASVVGLPEYLPAYGGLLLKKEITMISYVLRHPHPPVVAILGGAKISTKIKLIEKLLTIADTMILGGGLANTFLAATGQEVGKSLMEKTELTHAKRILQLAKEKKTELLLPADAIVGEKNGEKATDKPLSDLTTEDQIFDIGPQTQAMYGQKINRAKTLIWNGPVGLFEVDAYRRGTDFIYYAIAHNENAISVVGGGETLAALSEKDHLERITHISTGGGAMLEYIENGSLPGIEALK